MGKQSFSPTGQILLLILGLAFVLNAQKALEVREHLEWSLMCAAGSGDAVAVRSLLERGADVKAVDIRGRTALAMAVEGNHVEVAKGLIQKGADVNAKDHLGLSVGKMAMKPELKNLLEQAGAKDAAASSKATRSKPNDPILSQAQSRAMDTPHVAAVKELLDQGMDINARLDASGTTPLLMAAGRDRTNVVEFLLGKGADVNLPSFDLVTPLMSAVQNIRKSDHVVRLLLKNGANVSQPASWQRTVLLAAAEQDRAELVKLFLAHDADIKAEDEYGRTALMAGAQKGATNAVKALLDSGKYKDEQKQINAALTLVSNSSHDASAKQIAEIIRLLRNADSGRSAKPRTAFTELMQAARANDLERVKSLLKQGANVNDQGPTGETALMLAVGIWQPKNGSQTTIQDYAKLSARGDEIALLLLEKGSDFLPEDDQRQTAFQIAVNARRSRPVKALLDRGADKNANYFGYTDLMFAAIADDAARIKTLIEAEAQHHLKAGRYQFDQTAIHFAAVSGTNGLRALIEAGADINPKDSNQRTPLTLAAGAGNSAAARILIEKGALVKGSPALSMAAASGNLELVKLLLDNGASLAPEPGAGITPLMGALMGPNLDVLKFFLDKGVDVNTKNGGMTALQWATLQGKKEMAELLKKAGAKE